MSDPSLASRIESFFSARHASRPALFVPSGRFGLWLAMRHCLPRSSRVLLSPVTCDQVVYALLAAGMTPVFGPLNPATGNLDPGAITDEHWRSLDAVLTTNLYGVPDEMVRLRDAAVRHDVLLIEDACHAFDSTVNGKRIGTFGKCAVFSLAKHVGGAGGVLVFEDESDRAELTAMMRDGLGHPLIERAGSFARKACARLAGSRGADSRLVGHRDVFQRSAIERASLKAPDIKAFDAFLGNGSAAYRCQPSDQRLATTLTALENWEAESDRRRESVRQFRASGMVPHDLTLPDDSTLLRVPLFVEDREETIAKLAANGIAVSLVYDPPLHEQFPWIDSIAGPWTPAQARWCDNVLPIAPGQLARVLEARSLFRMERRDS